MNLKNGKEAKIGDIVSGKPHNTPHVVSGKLIGIDEANEGQALHVLCVASTTKVERSPAGAIKTLAEVVYGRAEDFELVYREEAPAPVEAPEKPAGPHPALANRRK